MASKRFGRIALRRNGVLVKKRLAVGEACVLHILFYWQKCEDKKYG